ncbi:pentatricopeptide repeat-containing protein [Canna indica]|uniref:Pentatricopeptide repeat-containing protein n=1 Tax=Canna indica TaxID=4628 RepID=A0AAQ3QB76_9LILI|nr:pentatricopeptide repeat-containing protein [Canna indica]
MRRKLRHPIFCHLIKLRSFLLHPCFPDFFPFQHRLSHCAFVPLHRQVKLFSPFSTCSDPKPGSVSSLETESICKDAEHANSRSNFHLGIGKSVISRCSYLWSREADSFLEESSLQDLLKLYGDLFPEITHRLWRVLELRPVDFLNILMGIGNDDLSLRQVKFLLKLFRWAKKQSADFNHLPRSYEIMVSVLTHARMYEDAESLLMAAEPREIFTNYASFFSDIVQGYAECCKSEKSIAMFDKARERGIIPSAASYQALLSLLIKLKKVEFVTKVYMDMINVGLASYSKDPILNTVVQGLTENKRILEAITLLRQLRGFGIKASHSALSAIAEGLCKKKDFEDMFNFLEEWGHVPEVCICNKIISSLCIDLNTQESWSFVQRMESLGFKPDAITFSILVCHSCKSGMLKDGFIYLSECLSRGVSPTVYIYNALIVGIFNEGLHRHAKDVLGDMLEKGVVPDQMTFRILLAGFCRYRKFDEVKEILADMRNQNLICMTSLEDALSKALMFLGLDHLNVKVKRDNNVGIPRSEFFDCLGNGLYLDTDIEEYETSLARILDSAIAPDFDSWLMMESDKIDIKTTLRKTAELIQWGQTISLSTYTKLLRRICATPDQLKEAIGLLDYMPELSEQLDAETLNLLLQKLSKNKMVDTAMIILERLFNRKLMVDSQSLLVLVAGLCQERNIDGLKECCNRAQRSMWLPGSKDIRLLFNSLCKWGLIKEALELFERMLETYPQMISSLSLSLLKELCFFGYTNVGCILMEELLHRNIAMDHSPYVYLSMGFLKEKKFVESLGILDMLLNKNMTMSVHVCQHFIPLLLRFNRIEEAITLRQLTRKPNSLILDNVLLSELCKARKLSNALSQLQDMLFTKMLPDDNALNALLKIFCLENDLQKACAVLGTLIRVHGNLSISGYRSLMCQMLLNGLISHALRLKDIIQYKDESSELSLYNILIFHLFQTGNSSIVETLLKDMQEKQFFPDKNTYDFLVHGFHKCGEVLKSVEALNMMICKGWRPSCRSLRIVICQLCNDGKYEKALELSKVMERNKWNHSSVIQNTLAGALLRCCGLSEAEFFLDRMNKKGLIPMKIDYNGLIQHFCMHARMHKAIDLLNVMLKRSNIPSEKSYSSVIHGFCLREAFDQSLDFHVEMLHKNLQPSKETCDSLVNGLCANGRTDDARRILRIMLHSGPIPTYHMYSHVLNSYHFSNNLDKASEFLHEMQLAGYTPNFQSHWSLISNLSRLEKNNDNDGKSILSGLLSGCSPSHKNSKGKAFQLNLPDHRFVAIGEATAGHQKDFSRFLSSTYYKKDSIKGV